MFSLYACSPGLARCLAGDGYSQGQEHRVNRIRQLCAGRRIVGSLEVVGMLAGLSHCHGLAFLFVTKKSTQIAYGSCG